ncbi:MAG: MerR family transcriptional regulator [Caldicoprobacterales bacterium]
MTIAEVSKRVGLSSDTLRYYERVGLIPKIKRNKNGIREYTEEDCIKIEFIKCMRKAGLPINVLKEYMALLQQGDTTTEARKQILIEQCYQLAEKIEEMKETLAYLDRKIELYEERLSKAEKELKAAQL